MPLFAYDEEILAVISVSPETIEHVLGAMRRIESLCEEGDGLRWFNWLYLRVTDGVSRRVAAGGFHDPAWLTELDVQFARLYFAAVAGAIESTGVPDSWDVLLSRRTETRLARIQFAMAGINAHINRDLAVALVRTFEALGGEPQHGDARYGDFTALNSTLEERIDEAKEALHVRLLGDDLPFVSSLHEALAAWSVGAARETAWINSMALWQLQSSPLLPPFIAERFVDSLDGLASLAGNALMVEVPG